MFELREFIKMVHIRYTRQDRRGGLVVERLFRMREIGVQSPVAFKQVVTAQLPNARQQV